MAHLQSGFQAAQAGHGDVHQHDVGLELHGLVQRLQAVPGLTHYLNILVHAQESAQPIPEHDVVIRYEDANLSHRYHSPLPEEC